MERKGATPVPVAMKTRVAQWRPQDEVAEWSLAADFFTLFHVAKKIRHEAVLHAIQAESKAVVLPGRGSDGVGAGDLFAVGLVGFEGEPLAGDEAEARLVQYLEFQVLGLGR